MKINLNGRLKKNIAKGNNLSNVKILLFRFLINEPTCLILLDSASEQVSIQLLKCLKIYFIAGFTKYSYPTTKIATQENIPVTDFQEILLVIN